jgi:hypothetical protein
MRALLLLLTLVLLPASVRAQPEEKPDAAAVAAEAASVSDDFCSEAAAGAATSSARAVARVSQVLAEVSEAHDATGENWLLYWRGILNACTEREERAAADFEQFLAVPDPDGLYAAQRQDAERRLRRLQVGSAGVVRAAGPSSAPGIAVGAGLLGGGAVLGGLSGWQGSVATQREADYQEGLKPWAETEQAQLDSETAGDAANGLLVGAIGLGAGGAVALVVSLATGGTPVAAVVVPIPDGLALSIGGRW